MSTKFEQLLDYLVNEDMDKANELFHEIVVEKSRHIYENLIAEEAEEESAEEQEEEMDEGMEELEDSYSMEGDDEDEIGGDATDEFGSEIGAGDEDGFGGEEGEEGGEEGEDSAMFDIKNAIAELEAAFAELEAAQGDEADEFGDDEGGDEFGAGDEDEFGGDEFAGAGGPEEEPRMGNPMEGRRMTREYVEKVGNDWEKNSQKTQGQYAGAGTGEKEGAPTEGRSPISSGKGKPTTGATAANIVRKSATSDEDGATPRGKVGGLVKSGGSFVPSSTHNVNNVKSGVKTLSKVAAGHGAEKKGAGPGPVGSGTGDKAGQTSIDAATKKPFIKPYAG